MRVAAIMPCRGRAEQTVRNVRRLLATAGDVNWQLICACDGDNDVYSELLQIPNAMLYTWSHRRGYWHTLNYVTSETDAPLIANLANDLLPGQHWLQRAVAAYDESFGGKPGMVGFNDGHHEIEHSCHFLISRALLARYGGWPVWYDHNFGDTELCERAIADGAYVKAPFATLFHDHPYFGGDDDSVYAEGRARSDQDYRLYQQRKAQRWPTIAGK